MNFIVESQGVSLSAARKLRLARTVRVVLGTLAARAKSISLHISDEGGRDRKRACCRVTIDMSRYRVVAHHRAANVATAVLRAVQKATRNLQAYRRRRAVRRRQWLLSKTRPTGSAAPVAAG